MGRREYNFLNLMGKNFILGNKKDHKSLGLVFGCLHTGPPTTC